MNDKENLQADLNRMIPTSEGFNRDLLPMLKERTVQVGKILIRRGRKAKRAWQLLTGIIVALKEDEKGNITVMKIICPGQIFTDLDSFFEGTPVRYSYVAVTKVSLLQIEQSSFIKLKKYAETAQLVQHIMLMEKQTEEIKTELFALHPDQRVTAFAGFYPIYQIPNFYAASFLRMEESDYVQQKLVQAANTAHHQDQLPIKRKGYLTRQDIAIEVQIYIRQNYNRADIGDTNQIAGKFHTTRKTLTRVFKDQYQQTVPKMILTLRMEKALQLLQEKRYSVSEIATAVGFESLFSFSRTFKKHYGYPPNKAI
ncbi:MAG: helix-turn-helix domain-containing protein [Bacteroidota bacterium]